MNQHTDHFCQQISPISPGDSGIELPLQSDFQRASLEPPSQHCNQTSA